ncbi:MAG: BlaI/MecI/CopY family transcriptional regulator [Phycisphaerae bacterium]|nr:BlaI/MecI/CopY family transcriptional regulator [Phycisphaerae bacterium]
MKTQPMNITPAEWDIMEVLWQWSPLSTAEIYANLQTRTDWSIKTIRSFLDRLVQKKAVCKDEIHGMNVFKPIPQRSQCLRQESVSFLQRFFQGNPVSLLRHFVEQESLSDQDIARLQAVLDKKKE